MIHYIKSWVMEDDVAGTNLLTVEWKDKRFSVGDVVRFLPHQSPHLWKIKKIYCTRSKNGELSFYLDEISTNPYPNINVQVTASTMETTTIQSKVLDPNFLFALRKI
jgi:hypothetical protein